MLNDILQKGANAVITGGASGIGLAAAHQLAARGMNVLLLDYDQEKLAEAEKNLQGLGGNIHTKMCDVADEKQMNAAATWANDTLGEVSFLMNNAGVIVPPSPPWEDADKWRKLFDINVWGVIYGTQAFVPAMIAHGKRGLVINTGSKQGMTRPPGNSPYNVSKATVIAFTEMLASELRQIKSKLSAHLLLPGVTYTGMISRFLPEKPPIAWTPEQVIDYMFESLEPNKEGRNDFYILCPDNEVTRAMDEKRIQWHADDIIKNRPALSRWHDDYEAAFAQFMKEGE